MRAERAGKPSPTRLIQGEAVVVDRKPMDAARARRPDPEPLNDNAAIPLAFPAHRRSRPDLLYPGAMRWHPAKRDGMRLFDTRIRPPRRAAAGGTLAAVILFACVLAAVWHRTTPQPALAFAAAAPATFSLTEAASTVTRRADGAVLAVEGRIRNLSPQAAIAPTVSVTLAGARIRTFQPSRTVIAPGASMFFHSTLALPSARSGERAVLSLEAAAKESS